MRHIPTPEPLANGALRHAYARRQLLLAVLLDPSHQFLHLATLALLIAALQ
jgi:hypothetical protein